jgi:hypothetical protein
MVIDKAQGEQVERQSSRAGTREGPVVGRLHARGAKKPAAEVEKLLNGKK